MLQKWEKLKEKIYTTVLVTISFIKLVFNKHFLKGMKQKNKPEKVQMKLLPYC